MNAAAENTTDPQLAEAVGHLAVETLGALVDALGVQGVAVVLAIGAVWLTVKSKKVREAEAAAVRWAVRAAWRTLRQLAGRRPRGITPTKEERKLLRRLAPAHWQSHAERRGLDGTLTGRARLTDGGIVVPVRLDGKWTAKALREREESVRALLGARTGLRIEVKAGKRGGWGELVIRTRSAADGDDLKWSPERRSFGVDTVTGTEVTIPLGERLLIAGRSGAGKSVASRPLLFDASEGATNALVIIDLKMIEGRLWDHRARVASTPDEVVNVVGELVAEMTYRLRILPKGQDKWTPTVERPRITLVVDEGAEVQTAAKDSLEGLESLARMGRAACIDLWWMTQKPTIGDGIPKQVAPQLSTRICLAVSTPTEARVVLGEDAQAKGWNADELPAPGVALVRDGKRKPTPVKVRYMDKSVVIGLPDQPIWHGPKAGADDQAPTLGMPRQISVTKDDEPDSEAVVIAALREGVDQVPALVDHTGLSRATVNRLLAALVEAGRAVRIARGRYAIAA